eukprot:4348350-Pleurochrysis_carterae.AAC.1
MSTRRSHYPPRLRIQRRHAQRAAGGPWGIGAVRRPARVRCAGHALRRGRRAATIYSQLEARVPLAAMHSPNHQRQ